MAILHGVVSQYTLDGVVNTAKPGQTTPFAQGVRFAGSLDLGRVDGAFAALTVRSVPAQTKPWPSLAEAIKEQRIYPLTNQQGTLIGIYTPLGVAALSPTGWHFHFLSNDRRRGGHVLALTTGPAKARSDVVGALDVLYPVGPLPRQNVAKPAAVTE